ncbi:MAG: hypothetical protein F4X12_12980 [Acidobacteriia bacterium]|nr:hypothetical protein [Terriglobia bacterium]
MNDVETSRLLLTHLSWRFHPPMEVLACSVLEYILNHHPDSRDGLNDLLMRIVPGMRLSGMDFETEVTHPKLGRLDVLQRGDDGEGRFVIEAKFDAPLMSTQPVSYLDQLPEAGVSALMFLVPTLRVEELWPQLISRLDREGISYAQLEHPLEHPRCVRIDGTEKHLCIIDWTTLLDSMKEPLEGDEAGRSDLRQLRGLVEFAEARESKARLPGKEMVGAVVNIGKAGGWLATKTMKGGTYGTTRHGRYARLDRRYKLGVWLGINSRLHRKFGSTPLWVCCTDWSYADGQGWNAGVKAILQARMGSKLHEVGKQLWVPVIPGGGKGPDRYAAALERIVGILDELAEPWHSDAMVLEEVSRPYKQRVMNNVHRSEYVEAIVALALKASGWTHMTPWDSWDFEHKSGARLEVKQSAAAQVWKSPEQQRPARFDIAPRTGYWDKEGEWVRKPGRHADLYVFAWHATDGDTADQRKAGSWEFYVVAERDLPEQKSIALTVLQELASPCGIDALAAAVNSLSTRHQRALPQP